MAHVLVRVSQREATQTQKESNVKMEADIGGMWPQTREHQGLPVVTRSWEGGMERILP